MVPLKDSTVHFAIGRGTSSRVSSWSARRTALPTVRTPLPEPLKLPVDQLDCN